MNQQEIWQLLVDNGAVWKYPNDTRSPHPVLRSGKHSDGFIDTLAYLSVVENMETAAALLAAELRLFIAGQRIDWVVGSPMAAIQFAAVTALELGARHAGFTEKVKGEG